MSAKDDTEGVLGIVLLGAGAWLIYEIWKGTQAAAAAVGAAQQAAGSAVADLFPTNQVVQGSGAYYSVTMPDGTVEQVQEGQLPVPTSQYVAPLDPADMGGTDTGGGFL
jgi:hypothetical protein